MKYKRILSCILLCAALFVLAAPTLAAEGDLRIAMGADLTAEQRAQIYRDFGVAEGSLPEIAVTNADERAYLLNYIGEEKIGKKALSCVFIRGLAPGQGLTVVTNNINYCTPDMYKSALSTAGVTDAWVMVSAPFPVSGTAALTGVYRAYESIAGNSLSELAKTVGAEELVTTGQLAEYIGSDQATVLIGELKGILDQTANMTDAEVAAQIQTIAKQYNIAVTDAQVAQLVKLCRSLEKLDADQLREKLVSIGDQVDKVEQASKKVTETVQKFKNVAQKASEFFGSIGGFFKNLFGAKG